MAKSCGKESASTHSALPALQLFHQRPQKDTDANAEPVSTEDFCSIKATEQKGIHVFYLPSVQNTLRSDWEEGELQQNPAESEKLRNHLTKEFHIPSWFWEKQGWDANGFFESKENPITNLGQDGTSHCSFSRFLLKEVEDQVAPEPPKYHWRFLAFATLWFRKKQDEKATLILLCFDLIETQALPSGSMHNVFEKHLRKLSDNGVLQCPYGVYMPLIEVVVSQYNRAIWTFRGPVRRVEKSNDPKLLRGTTNPSTPVSGKSKSRLNESPEDIEKDRNKKVQSYRHMHELSRHIIHASETLQVAIRTVSDIIRASKDCLSPCCSEQNKETVARKKPRFTAPMQFHASFLQNLNERTDAFYRRIQNEITLAFHLVDAEDTSYTRQILEETKHDGRELTNVVAVLSILFLPPTFTAGFFGMNFPFGFGSMKPIWIWVVATAVLWIAAFFTLYHSRHKRHKVLDGSLTQKKKRRFFSKV